MAHVFVSYASVDAAFATDLATRLGDEGHSVFFAPDPHAGIKAGERWKKRLFREVGAADAVVCVVTPAFSASPWCSVEVNLADTIGVTLLPLSLAGAVSPLMDEIQHVDCDAPDWHDRLRWHLREIDGHSGGSRADQRSPFPGLAPFEMAMRRWFHGRTTETRRLTSRLRSLEDRASGGLVVVVGPSGCGKSSLVRAGLAATLADDQTWQVVPPFTPGPDPVGALDRALRARFDLPVDWSLGRDDEGALLELAEEVLSPGQRLLVVIDQGDELLTPVADPERRSQLLRLVKRATAGPVRVVMTLRSDLQDRLLALPELAGVSVDVQPLRPLAGDVLRDVVEKPARLARLTIEPELVTRLVADAGGGGALPLLAFTLQQLAEGLERGDTISADRYDQLGGVRGALSEHAETALIDAAHASGLAPEKVLDGLVQLAAIDASGRRVRRRVDLDSQGSALRTALEVLLERRLLTADSDGVAVAHEALFDAWAPFAAAIDARANALAVAWSLCQTAADWRAGDRSDRYFWSDDRLSMTLKALGYEPTVAGPLSPIDPDRAPEALIEGDHDLEFLQANRAHAHAGQRRRQRRWRGAFAFFVVLVAVLTVATTVAVIQARESEEQRRLAAARGLASLAAAAPSRDPSLALALGVAAFDVAPDGETRSSLVTSLIENHYLTTLSRNGLAGPDDPVPISVGSVAFAPDRALLAADAVLPSSDPESGEIGHGVRLWDVSDPTEAREIGTIGHENGAWGLAFSPDGQILALGGAFSSLALWDVGDPSDPVRLSVVDPVPADVWITSVAFSGDGDQLLVGTWDNSGARRDAAALWDIADPRSPRPLATLAGGTGAVHDVAFDPERPLAATANDDGNVTLWDLGDPNAPTVATVLTDHTNAAWSVDFSPDGNRLATAGADRDIILWDITDPVDRREIATLAGHDGTVSRVAFSPDGDTLLSASYDGTAVQWDVRADRNPGRLDTVAGHADPVLAMSVAADGHTVATGAEDGTVVLWDTRDGATPPPLGTLPREGVAAISPIVASPAGGLLATGSLGGTVLLWDLGDPRGDPALPSDPVAVPNDGTGPSYPAGFSADGTTLVTTNWNDGTTTVWDVGRPASPDVVTRFVANPSGVASASLGPDGTVLATGHNDGTATLWRIHDSGDPPDPAPLTPRDGTVRAVSISPDGNTLVEASTDHSIVFWDISDPTEPDQGATHVGPSSIYSGSFSYDGRWWASAEEGRKASLWDVDDPDHPRQLSVAVGNASSVYAAGIDRSATLLATGGFDRTVILWDLTDVEQPQRLLNLPAYDRSIDSAVFLPDRQVLAVGTQTTVELWDVRRLAEIVDDPGTVACDLLGEGLGREDWERYAPQIEYRPTCPR